MLGIAVAAAPTAYQGMVAYALTAAAVGAGGYGTYQAAAHGYYAAAGLGAVLTGLGAYQLATGNVTLGAQPVKPGGAQGPAGPQLALSSESLSDADNDIRNAASQPQQDQGPAPMCSAKTCTGFGRIIKGTADLIGQQGAFPGVRVQPGTAAVIPDQFSMTKSELSQYLNQISGKIAGVGGFEGISDVIGGESPLPGMGVRDALQVLNPSTTIIELPGGGADMGTRAITLTVPNEVPCPAGTRAGVWP
jgi:hypothetical protein